MKLPLTGATALILSAVAAGTGLAQEGPQATRDSGRVVIATILGGDSAQATLVQLRRGSTYLVSARPATAEVIVRQAARGERPSVTLEALPAAVAPAPDARVFVIVPMETGAHLLELVNFQGGAAQVGITFMRMADSDTLSTRVLACSRAPESQACVKPAPTSRLGMWLALASIPIVRFVLLR